MSLLHEIQDGATEDTVSLGSLLRKTKLLATRIGVKEIGKWAERELSGYNDNAELPPYRGPFDATVLGNAMGSYGRQVLNLPIPPMALSEKFRDVHLLKLYFSQGVVELESLAAAKQTLQEPWPSEAVMMFPMLSEGAIARIDPEITLIEVWKHIPYSAVVGVLDAIRTRLLDFTMQLEQEEPLVEREQRLPDPKHAANILNTIVYANTANVAVGNRDVTQTQKQELPVPFDIDGLLDYMRGLGLDDDLIDDLQIALEEDTEEEGGAGESHGPGRKVWTWLKNATATVTTNVGMPVATTLVTQALLNHFGLVPK